jgi:hypothetical protein
MNLKRRSLLYPGRRFKRPLSPDAEERKERDASQYLEDVEQAVAPYMRKSHQHFCSLCSPFGKTVVHCGCTLQCSLYHLLSCLMIGLLCRKSVMVSIVASTESPSAPRCSRLPQQNHCSYPISFSTPRCERTFCGIPAWATVADREYQRRARKF